jgi:hypothetical protein
MSLYIHSENQELLWNVISKTSIVQQYFVLYHPSVKENWFKSIISSFYEQNRNIRPDQLFEMNKTTLTYMVNDIKRNIQYQQEKQEQQQYIQEQKLKQEQHKIGENYYMNNQKQQGSPNDYLKPYSVTQNKEDGFLNEYNKYQNNYHSVFEKKPPDSIDFREKIEDGYISNMDELVKKHMKERDEELNKIPQPTMYNRESPFQKILPEPIKNENTNQRLIIDPESKNIQIQIEELNSNNIFNATQNVENEIVQNSVSNFQKDKKNEDPTVKWLDNENSEKIKSLEKEIIELKKLVLQISEKLFDPLKNEMEYPLKIVSKNMDLSFEKNRLEEHINEEKEILYKEGNLKIPLDISYVWKPI